MRCLEDDPEYRAAIQAAEREEAARRERPYFGVEIELCGLKVNEFTPRHFITLVRGQNAFLVGGDIEPEDVMQFLWVVGSEKKNRKAWEKRVLSLEISFFAASDEIRKYLEEAFADSPGGKSGSQHAPTSFTANIVDALASEYGWSETVIVDLPFINIFQYLRLIRIRRAAEIGKRVTFVNRLVAKLNKWFAEKEIERRKEGKKKRG